MSRYHGVTSDTYRRFVIDSGEVRLGYVDATTQGTLLGATRGGSVFSIETEYKDMAVDGAKGPVKGGRRITKVTAKMTVNMVEITPTILGLALTGSTTEETPAGAATHEELKRALEIALTNYSSSVALLGEVSGSGHPIVCIIQNVLNTGNFEISASDNEESIVKLELTAHFDPDDLDTEPWIVRFPLDVLTTEGA